MVDVKTDLQQRLERVQAAMREQGVGTLVVFSSGQHNMLRMDQLWYLADWRSIGPSALLVPSSGPTRLLVTPVWDLERAYRETTGTRERVCLNGLWRWQPGKGPADAVPTERWGYFKVPGCWPAKAWRNHPDREQQGPQPPSPAQRPRELPGGISYVCQYIRKCLSITASRAKTNASNSAFIPEKLPSTTARLLPRASFRGRYATNVPVGASGP